jgi:hypothetical protein
MSPKPGPRAPAPPQTSLFRKLRWPLVVATVAGVLAVVMLPRGGKKTPAALDLYQREIAALEKEYRLFYGRLLREPELEHRFHGATEFVDANNYNAAIEILERVSHAAAVPVVFHNLGVLYATVGDRARAIAAFREALARDAEYRPVRETIERLRMFTADEANPVRQELEPNNSEVVPNLIAVGRAVDGEIEAGDTDTFRFVTPAAPRDIVEVGIENVDSSLEMGVRMHDGEMTRETGRVLGAKGEHLKRFVAQPPNKALYLQLWGAHESTGKYRILLRPLKSFDSHEPNDDIFAARRIDLNKTIEANIMDSQDTDFYSFQSLRTGPVTIELKNESSTLTPALTVFNADRRNMGFGPDVQVPGGSLKHTIEVVDFQTYYLQVWPQSLSSGKYTLTIR